MTGSAFSLCPTCGHIKPAGVVDCEFCSPAQTKVSLSDLKGKITGAKNAPEENQNVPSEPSKIESEPVRQPSGIEPQSKTLDTEPVPSAIAAPHGSDKAASETRPPTAAATSPTEPSKDESPQEGGFVSKIRRFFKGLFG